MRILIILIFILFTINPCYSFGFFQKKDYKQNFINDALRAEKRNNKDSAFHLFEKALYYYPKDKSILEAYAGFCEREKYFDKALEIYKRLYVLTKNPNYLFKKDVAEIKKGNLSKEQIQKLTTGRHLTKAQQNEINIALIYYFSAKRDWQNTKKSCDKIKKDSISKDVIDTCIASTVRTNDKMATYQYLQRYSEIYPQNIEVIKRIISLAGKYNDYKTGEAFIKKFSELFPYNDGIKYSLAGLYEKHGDWKKAAKVYKNLMASGDKSEHVKTSYTYVLSKLNPKPVKESAKKISKKGLFVKYIPKPLSGFKLSEKLFYDAWKEKKYDEALLYLSQMLESQPKNAKLLKHRVDIYTSVENYKQALSSLEELQEVKPLSKDDKKLLAFLYSKTDNYQKAVEIIEDELKNNADDKALLTLALEYSMALKDWDKAIIYAEKLLTFEPQSEKLLKSAGDLYSAKKDFPMAIKYYEQLVEYYPNIEYKLELSNLYMAEKDFAKAQCIIEPLYAQDQNNSKITIAFLNSLLAQQKLMDAYFVVKRSRIENTKEGYSVLGDLDMEYKHYNSAACNYYKALQFAPEDITMLNKLADAYRLSDNINSAQSIYCCILSKDPKNFGARMGIAAIETKKKHYDKARQIYCALLGEDPNYKPAKVGIAYSYVADGDSLNALDTLNKIAPDQETNLLKSQIYYDMNMPTDAKGNLAYTTGRDAEALRYKIRRDDAITFTPTYSFLKQQLAEEFRLNYQMGGIRLAKNIDRNTNVFMNYNVYIYSSEDKQGLNNVTHEFRGGAQGRPTERWEYRTDLGVKVFEFDNGAMVVTDDWIKYHFNDKFNMKLGFSRDNLIQTYTSAVGEFIDGRFTGRVADTRTYLEYLARLPYDCYSFGRGVYGVMYAQNLPTNQYLEGMLGVGKLIYNNPKNPVIQKVNFDLVSFNWAFQYDLLNLYNSAGVLFGGYFSPSFFTADTANLRIEGEIKKLKLKYGCTGFAGVQVSRTPDFTTFTWGVGPYLSYRVNDHIDINAYYQFFNYAFMQRHLFMVSAVIRGFSKNAKN